jgi:hypothetical protein
MVVGAQEQYLHPSSGTMLCFIAAGMVRVQQYMDVRIEVQICAAQKNFIKQQLAGRLQVSDQGVWLLAFVQ